MSLPPPRTIPARCVRGCGDGWLANFASSWFLAPLLTAYVLSSSAALHVRRLLNVVDLYVSVDILECPALARLISSLQPLAETDTTYYEEVKAYGVPERRRVLAPCRTRASSAPRAATASSSACATARTSPTSSAGALVLGGAGPVVKLLRARTIFIK